MLILYQPWMQIPEFRSGLSGPTLLSGAGYISRHLEEASLEARGSPRARNVAKFQWIARRIDQLKPHIFRGANVPVEFPFHQSIDTQEFH